MPHEEDRGKEKKKRLTTLDVYKSMREYFERKDLSIREPSSESSAVKHTEYYKIKEQEY